MNKNYEAKCKMDHGELFLSITHNGYQWISISIKDPGHEIPLIIDALVSEFTAEDGAGDGGVQNIYLKGEPCPQCGFMFGTM